MCKGERAIGKNKVGVFLLALFFRHHEYLPDSGPMLANFHVVHAYTANEHYLKNAAAP